MKKAFIFILASFALLWATQSTVTNTKNKSGGMDSYWFTFTNAGAQDTAIIVPSDANYFNTDQYDNCTLRFDTGEATADSVRWSVQYQVKTKATDSWVIAHTFTDTNSTAYFLHANIFTTYGKFPFTRFLMIGAAAKNAVQSVTGQVVFDKEAIERD